MPPNPLECLTPSALTSPLDISHLCIGGGGINCGAVKNVAADYQNASNLSDSSYHFIRLRQ